MRIGVVSDTHGHLGNTRKAVAMLGDQKVEQVLHCGDIGSADVIPLLDGWPVHYVFGNCDHDAAALTKMIELANQVGHGLFGDIALAGRRIALIHGHEHRRFRDAIASQEYDLVCYGHTHVPEQHFEGKTLVVNPGALYRANPCTLAVIDLARLAVTHLEVD
jgi:hypothetical protein